MDFAEVYLCASSFKCSFQLRVNRRRTAFVPTQIYAVCNWNGAGLFQIGVVPIVPPKILVLRTLIVD